MDEILLKRLTLINKEIECLSTLAIKISLDTETLFEAEIIQNKLSNLLKRFNDDLYNYFNLVKNPSADDVSEMSEVQLRAEENLSELSVKISSFIKSKPERESTQTASTSCRLPKLNLPEFDGEIINWHQFWDQFQSNIDDRNIPDVDKLLYLKSSVKGEAKRVIDGLDISNKNYKIAVNALKERFGKHNFLIDAHYSALSKILPSSTTTITSYRKTLNEVENHLRVLEALGEDVNHNHLRHIIISKFPEELVYELKLKIKEDSILEIRRQLEKIISAREEANRITQRKDSSENENYTVKTLHVTQGNKDHKKMIFKGKGNFKRNFTSHGAQQNQDCKKVMFKGKRNYRRDERNEQSDQRTFKRRYGDKNKTHTKEPARKRARLSCIFCREDHYNDQCKKYKTTEERKSQLKNNCYGCFQKGHSIKFCKQNRKCCYCHKFGHNRALCLDKFSTEVSATATNTLSAIFRKSTTILQTAVVNVLNDKFQQMKCRILLDSGSQRSYVTPRVVKKLQLPIEEEERLSVFTFGTKTPQEFDSSIVKLILETRTQNKRIIYANVVPTISTGIPCTSNKFNDCIEERLLADDGSTEQIDILIGNDYYYNIMKEEKIQINENLFLVNSEFGWVVSGKMNTDPCATDKHHTLSVVTFFQAGIDMKLNPPDPPLDQGNVTFLWDLEAIGITDCPRISREEEAINNFNRTTEIKNNRYTVSWPWNSYPPALTTNYGLAYGRLVSLFKRLDKETLVKYDATLKEQINKGIIEEINPNNFQNHPIHYLPHHSVAQKGKSIRIVYDASAKTQGNNSLNECLYCGPLLLEDLTGLLIRFRYHRIALSADVEKAFLQIALHDRDRDVTRFLWVKDTTKPATNDNLMHLRFCRVPFGIISSPFLLNATIKHHLSKDDNLRNIANDIYVDNLLTGEQSEEKALKLYEDLKKSFQQISMNLREWSSNSTKFMQKIPDAAKEEIVKILGLNWNLMEDTLQLRFNPENCANTKRGVLKTIASVYDPCGFAVPHLLHAKLFLQGLWKAKVKWDTELCKEMSGEWSVISEKLKDIKEIEVPRCYLQNMNKKDYQLHCFTDASLKAYAAVVYILNGNKVSFVIGKSRLVPIKDQQHLQIPRLELLGVLIGSRLINFVLKSLRVEISQQMLWTDSQIVIEWLKTDKLLPPFISRRVEEIKKNKELIIRYVPTELNPADIATRPKSSKIEKQIWLLGPQFLSKKPAFWPSQTTAVQSSFLLIEEGLANKAINSEETLMDKDYSITEKENNFSMQENRLVNSITEEIKILQAKYFPREFNDEETDLKRNLKLFKDIDGVLRCKGRLKNTDWSFDKKYPILIPKDSEFTDKIIMKTHNDNYHVGVNHTMSIIRQTYWIPQGKSKIKKLLRKCPRCVKHGGGPFQLPPTPALPPERVNYSAPFTYTGLDYLGPVLIKHQNGTEKRWICLFTCMAVRAIHLEIVKDLTAEEGLLALRRMIASRGIPEMITSDNATNFKLISESLTKPYCIQNNIKWRFIPQLSPWFGGFYERLIGIVKTCMKRTLMKHFLNDSQLATVVKEIESVVNSRPLTCVDSELEHILKPADFLTVGRCLTLDTSPKNPVVEGTTTKLELIKSWKKALVIRDEFKDMFTNRYLLSLRERYNSSLQEPRIKAKSLPQVGQIVQIKGEGKNREDWKVGKITALPKGSDGHCRIAKVNVNGKEFIRSIAHLYPLEIENENEGNFHQELDNENSDTRLENSCEEDDSLYLCPNMTVQETDLLETRTDDPKRQYDKNKIDTEVLERSEPQEVDVRMDFNENETYPAPVERSEPQETDVRMDSNENETVPAPNPKRAAAKKALRKIKEWTRDLQCLFASLPVGSVAN